MSDTHETAQVVKQWLTLESENGPEAGDQPEGAFVPPDPDIAEAKRGLDSDIEPVREKFASLLFSGQLDWLGPDDSQLEQTLPQWFLPGSNDEYYLEDFASSRTDIGQALNFLTGRLALWANGAGIPEPNAEYTEDGWPDGTQWYKYDGTQWLYSPAQTGSDWQTMAKRTEDAAARASVAETPLPETAGPAPTAAPEQAAVDLGTPEAAQDAAHDVATAAQTILTSTLDEAGPAGVPAERLKQLALAALTHAAREERA